MAHFGPCSQDTQLKSVGHKILLKGNISSTTPFDYLLVFNLTTIFRELQARLADNHLAGLVISNEIVIATRAFGPLGPDFQYFSLSGLEDRR